MMFSQIIQIFLKPFILNYTIDIMVNCNNCNYDHDSSEFIVDTQDGKGCPRCSHDCVECKKAFLAQNMTQTGNGFYCVDCIKKQPRYTDD